MNVIYNIENVFNNTLNLKDNFNIKLLRVIYILERIDLDWKTWSLHATMTSVINITTYLIIII